MDGLKERLQPLSSQTFLSTTQIRVWWPPRDPSHKQCMEKILIVWMIFGSKLLSSFGAKIVFMIFVNPVVNSQKLDR